MPIKLIKVGKEYVYFMSMYGHRAYFREKKHAKRYMKYIQKHKHIARFIPTRYG